MAPTGDTDLVGRRSPALAWRSRVHRVAPVKVAGTLASCPGVRRDAAAVTSRTGAKWSRTATARGPLLPAALSGVVLAVLGLDTRPQFRRTSGPPTRAPRPPRRALVPPNQVADSTGSRPAPPARQTIAVIELGGGFSASDLNTYFAA